MLSIVLAWETFKDWLSGAVHLTHWNLHVVFGLTLFLLFARLLRRPLMSFLPLLPVAFFELCNETLDFLRTCYGHWYWNWPDTLIEIALTLGPPLGLAAIARNGPTIGRLAASFWLTLRFPPRCEHISITVKDDVRRH